VEGGRQHIQPRATTVALGALVLVLPLWFGSTSLAMGHAGICDGAAELVAEGCSSRTRRDAAVVLLTGSCRARGDDDVGDGSRNASSLSFLACPCLRAIVNTLSQDWEVTIGHGCAISESWA
jgi:hypothetical protein